MSRPSPASPAPSPQPFEVTLELDGDVASLGIRGDVDVSTCDDVRRIVGGAISLGARSFLIDCHETTYLDSSGVRFLVELHRSLQERGGTIAIRNASPAVRRVIQITGLETLIHLT